MHLLLTVSLQTTTTSESTLELCSTKRVPASLWLQPLIDRFSAGEIKYSFSHAVVMKGVDLDRILETNSSTYCFIISINWSLYRLSLINPNSSIVIELSENMNLISAQIGSVLFRCLKVSKRIVSKTCKDCFQRLLLGQLIRDRHFQIHTKVRKYEGRTFFLTNPSFFGEIFILWVGMNIWCC